jgi:hypothetical protein
MMEGEKKDTLGIQYLFQFNHQLGFDDVGRGPGLLLHLWKKRVLLSVFFFPNRLNFKVYSFTIA